MLTNRETLQETLPAVVAGLALVGNLLAALLALLALAGWWGLWGPAGAYLALWLLAPLTLVLVVAALCAWVALLMRRYWRQSEQRRSSSPTSASLVWLALPGSLLLLAWLLHLNALLKGLGSMIWSVIRSSWLLLS